MRIVCDEYRILRAPSTLGVILVNNRFKKNGIEKSIFICIKVDIYVNVGHRLLWCRGTGVVEEMQEKSVGGVLYILWEEEFRSSHHRGSVDASIQNIHQYDAITHNNTDFTQHPLHRGSSLFEGLLPQHQKACGPRFTPALFFSFSILQAIQIWPSFVFPLDAAAILLKTRLSLYCI